MAKAKDSEVAFGEIQGTTIEGVEAYSNGSDMYFSGERNYDGEIMTGFKWQCVEFARRWLLERKGLLLPDLPWACMIFVLKEVERVADGSKVRTLPIKNGGRNKPEPGLLIWPSTEDNFVGHVAAITEVGDDWVRVADQNHTFHKWTGHFGRQLKVKVENGTYTIIDSDGHTVPLGWVTFPGVPDRDRSQPLVFAPQYKRPEPGRMYLDRITFIPKNPKENWLDLTNAAEKKFVETFGMDVSRSRLNEGANYYKCSWELMLACVKAGSQLHQMFLKATEHVLASDELLSRFGIDPVFWPRIRNSFVHEKDCITGRFDFAFKDNDIKCFEYNADSASTLLECSRIQEKWAESVGITEGSRSSGFRLQSLLRYAWKETGLHGRLHLLIDDDDEEEYTALTVGEGAVAAGMEIKLCKMFDEFHWKGGHIYDKDGVQVKTVWKTWMWESAISDYYKAQQERPADWKPHDGDAVRLCDLMLGHSGIRVFEPIWKLIPSNKAILPVLYELFPGHPNLLPTFWELTPELQKSGYVRKPIVGRVGRNVTVCDSTGELLKQSEGNFGDRDMIYQQLFSLPKRDDYYAILGGWIIGNGYYGGTGIREDKTIITGVDSPFSALRIVMDPVVGMPKAINHDNVDAELAAALEV